MVTSEMRAWSVAVMLVTPHGQALFSIFVRAADRAEALAAGVRNAVTAVLGAQDPNYPVNIVASQVTPIDRNVVFEAAVAMGIHDGDRAASTVDD